MMLMMKRNSFAVVFAMAVALLLPLTAGAQHGLYVPHAASRHAVKQKQLPSQRVAKRMELEKRYKALFSVKNMGETENKFTSLSKGKTAKALPAKSPMLRTPDGRELYGNIVYSELWDFTSYGLYSFNATSDITTTMLWQNDDFAANGGGAMVGGKFHAVNYYTSDEGLYVTHFVFDVETGDEETYEPLTDISCIATETAVASDGTVYGQFYNDATGLPTELGTIDYTTMTRTKIGDLTKNYVALGVTSDKVLYGVASDGNLYSIDSKTAKETLVGPTGLTLTTANGGTLGQSGEIDPKTNTFYWAAIDGNYYSALYTVDLTTGAATEVGMFPGSEQVYALSIPKPAAEDDAPAAVEDIVFSFEGASLTGKATFTAPSKTFAGGDLSGSLTYTITADGDTVAEGTATAGEKVEKEVTVSGSGTHEFVVTTANTVGSSPKNTVSQYVGYDQTYPVENVQLKGNSTTGEMTLTWDAPTGGYNDGYIGDLTYEVTRYPEGKVVATGLTETTFSETVSPEEITAFSYGVVAVNGDQRSDENTSSKVVAGPAVVPPYDNDFADESSLDLMTIIDSNDDYSTWGYHYERQCAAYVYSMDNEGDDWLLTPAIKMEAGKEYTVTFTASAMEDFAPEKLEVKYGVGDDPTAFEGTLLEPTVITSKKEFTASIIPTAASDMRIAFHAISEPNMFNLLLHSVHVSAGASTEAPDSVAKFTVTPGAEGALNATIGFTLPTKTIGGKTLSSVTKAEIYRDGEVLTTIEDGLAPGSNKTYTDKVDKDTTYSYRVVLYNESGVGRNSATKSAFIGTDVPAQVDASSIKVVDNGTSIDVSWDAVAVGKNGGYINPATVTYNLYDRVNYDDFYGYEYGEKIASVTGAGKTTITKNTDEGDQEMFQVFIQPENEKGQAFYSFSAPMVIGEAYSIPFSETFPDGGMDNSLWWLDNSGFSTWSPVSWIMSEDGTPGIAVFEGSEDSALLGTGKIAPNGADNLKLYYSYSGQAGAQVTMQVEVQKPDGTITKVDNVTVDNSEDEEGAWQTKTVSLNDFANERYIIVRFNANGNGWLYLDNVVVRNVYADDLSASMTAPEKLKKGQKGKVSVVVTNLGENVAEGYSVQLADGDKVVATTEATKQLQPLATDTLSIDYEPSVFDEKDEANLTATVVYSKDKDESNNTATATVSLISSVKPVPTSVAASKTADGIQLAWAAPAIEEKEVTDGFEDYTSWTMDSFGDWTCFDGDKGIVNGIFAGGYDNAGERFAFEIVEPEATADEIYETNPEFKPHSGNKYAAAMYSLGENEDGDYIFTDADNWLISPTLNGEAQTIKFYALNQADSEDNYPETFQLLYSTTDTDTASFTLVDTKTVESGEWEEISFDIPAGATHFAIRHITSLGGYMFAIDDVTYKSGAGILTGYNVYRNNEYVTTVDTKAMKYVDAGATDENCVYAVSAVYTDGESAPVAVSVATAIDNVKTDGQKFNVYTLEGKLVGEGLTSKKNLHRGVYVINGQKVTVK